MSSAFEQLLKRAAETAQQKLSTTKPLTESRWAALSVPPIIPALSQSFRTSLSAPAPSSQFLNASLTSTLAKSKSRALFPNMDDLPDIISQHGTKKFLDFYVKKHSCSPLQIKITLLTVDKTQYWLAKNSIDPAIFVKHTSKKTATKTLQLKLCQHLLKEDSANILDSFAESVKPIAARISDHGAKLVTVAMPEVDTIRDLVIDHWKYLKSKESILLQSSPRQYAYTQGKIPLIRPEDLSLQRAPRRPTITPPPCLGSLPISSMYSELIYAIDNYPVVIVAAETGAGKSTQLPQFIVKHYQFQKQAHLYPKPSVLVTQPRRIAAMSVAERVASEMDTAIGGRVGYQVRFNSKRPNPNHPHGTINFVTSGVLLQQFRNDPLLTNYTHIILDEVHERDLNTDLLLSLLRDLVADKRKDLKVILMSATADTRLFQQYFKQESASLPPPVIGVPGRCFPVKERYLDDILGEIDSKSPAIKAAIAGDIQVGRHLQSEMSKFNEAADLPLRLIEGIIAHTCKHSPPGAILVFLPGWAEIQELHDKLLQDQFRLKFNDPHRFCIHLLHSHVESRDQANVFETPPEGVRKIILSTNIAETSVTIKDVVYVIDSCRVRINQYDASRRLKSLNSVLCSQSNIRQRIGRAGRIQSGEYLSIISRERKESLPASIAPELLRVDLQEIILLIKGFGLSGSARAIDFLSRAPEPPTAYNIEYAIERLIEIGALNADESLTTLAELPVEPWIGKILLHGILFKCLDPMLTLASILASRKSLFTTNSVSMEARPEARRYILKHYARGSSSDQITMLNAFNEYQASLLQRQQRKRGEKSSSSSENLQYINIQAMRYVDSTKKQLHKMLHSMKLIPRDLGLDMDSRRMLGGPAYNVFSEHQALISGILSAALYPNIARICGKNVYEHRSERMFIDGRTVNRMRAPLSQSQDMEEETHDGMDDAFSASSSLFSPTFSAATSISTNNLSNANAGDVEIGPQFLCFEEKHMVDGVVFMRSTSRVNFFCVFTLTGCKFTQSSSSVSSSLYNSSVEGNITVDGWIKPIDITLDQIKLFNSFRLVLDLYLKNTLAAGDVLVNGGGAGGGGLILAEDDGVTEKFIQSYASIVEANAN